MVIDMTYKRTTSRPKRIPPHFSPDRKPRFFCGPKQMVHCTKYILIGVALCQFKTNKQEPVNFTFKQKTGQYKRP